LADFFLWVLLKMFADVLKNRFTCKLVPLVFACFSIKLRQFETSIKMSVSVTQDSISIDKVVHSETPVIQSHFLEEVKMTTNHKICCHIVIRGQFHILNVTFRRVSSKRRQDPYIQTDSRVTRKPLSERMRAQK